MLEDSSSVALLRVNELKSRLDRGETLALLDVREDSERAYAAIPVPATVSNLHVPMARIPDHLNELRAAARVSPVVVYCHHGMRSMMVATWLTEQGLQGVHNLEGGIDAWSIKVDPEVRRY